MTLLDLGIDIGGTKIALGLSKKRGLGLARESYISAQAEMDPKTWYARLKTAIDQILGPDRAAFLKHGRVGLGIPGQILPDGSVGHCANTPVLRKFNLIQSLKRDFRVPVLADNDANVAALAEHQFGAGRGVQNMVYVTISTGVGGGIIQNGKLMLGKFHNAGEVGHTILQLGGERCGCGRYGCLEVYARGPALEARIRTRLRQSKLSAAEKKLLILAGGSAKNWSNHLLGQALRQGNSVAKAELDRHGYYLAEGLGSLMNILDSDCLVLGGGLTQLGKPLFDAIIKHWPQRSLVPRSDIRRATLGADIGIYGAIALCRQ